MSQTVEAVRILLKDPSTGKYLIPYVDLAEGAKTDKNGNDIPETYATKTALGSYLPLSGGTVTGLINGTITNAQAADSASSANYAGAAGSATGDSLGQAIADTYIKSVRTNGTQVIFTRGNGTEFSVWTQDTNTVSSNWSVSNGTNGWARDNSTGFTIQWGYSSVSVGRISFPRSFGAVHSVVATKKNPSDTDASMVHIKNFDGGSFAVAGTYAPANNNQGVAHSWLAVGFS